MTLGDALVAVGMDLDGGRLQVVEGTYMRPVDPRATASELADGSLFTVIDPSAPQQGLSRRERAAEGARARAVGPWWGQAVVGLVVVSLALTGSLALVDTAVVSRALVVVVLGVAALVGAVVAVRQASADAAPVAPVGDEGPADVGDQEGPPAGAAGDGARAARVAGPAALGAAAVVVALPTGGPGDAHLLMVVAALAVLVLSTLAVTVDPSAHSRPALGAAAVILAVAAGVWGVALGLGWGAQVAAAILAGAVPVALRALPTFLIEVPDGYFIDYEKFQDTRWSVRGRMPVSPGKVHGDAVKDQVRGALAAQVTGTLMLSVIGAVALLFAVSGDPASLLVRIGQIALLVCFAVSMTLLGRKAGVPHLQWAPRGAAVIAVGVAVGMVIDALTGSGLLLGVVAALLVGLAAGALAVALGRGARSLVLSRVGDWVEAITIAFCLPAGLLAADMLEAVRSLIA
ncbi:MAG: hypothetical protein FWD18_11300 [Micrococcales bacterium]|nr:hypothetical protein [Micrococcales bacterium]